MSDKVQPAWPPAVVLNLSRNGLGVIRSLGSRGIPVIGVDVRDDVPGTRSRYCQALRCPDPNQDEAGLLTFFRDLAERLGQRAVVFPTSDDYVRFLSKYRAELEDEFRLMLPTQAVIDLLVDKRQFYEASLRLHVQSPASFFPEDEATLLHSAQELSYPALIKPTMSHTAERPITGKALRVESGPELIAAYRSLPGRWSDLMVQEMVPGGDETLWTLGAYLNADSRPLAIFCGRKLRQYPPHFGTCSLGECVWELDVVKLGLRLLKGIGYVGPTQVEFKRDPRDGRLKLMEVNARTWLWHTLAADDEVDIAYVAYLDLIGRPPARRVLGKSGARWLSIIADAASARRYIRRGELSWVEWLRSWRGVRQLDLLSLRDPMPFFSTLWNVFRRKVRSME